MAIKEVLVPDMGGTDSVDVIEFSVQEGDQIAKEDSLLVLESDKATVEVPAPFAGKLKRFLVSVGQSVKEGDPLAEVEVSDESASEQTSASEKSASDTQPKKADQKPPAESKTPTESKSASAEKAKPAASEQTVITIPVPDIGGGDAVDVIEVSVQECDTLELEQTMIVLESDKATMEVPSPKKGTVRKVLVSVGDKVAEGDDVLELLVDGESEPDNSKKAVAEKTEDKVADTKATNDEPSAKRAPASESETTPQTPSSTTSITDFTQGKPSGKVHAGPAVRRLARELGVDLVAVKATGPKARIMKEDVHQYVKQRMTESASVAGASSGLPPLPEVDFSKWGDIEKVELNKINKLSAANLHRAWVNIPHVTQFDEADITELERFRKTESQSLKDVKLTVLAFIVKACANGLAKFPRFNSSLSVDGSQLILKKYINIGIAVDTPNGLVVPVIRDADKKSVVEIATAMSELSEKARSKKLSPADMQGGCFSISSLGGIGGTAFTPIVNWPEVAILGVSRSQFKPVYVNDDFEPRLMLPLSLSYDHRVIDGADAARFAAYLSRQLSDIRRLLL